MATLTGRLGSSVFQYSWFIASIRVSASDSVMRAPAGRCSSALSMTVTMGSWFRGQVGQGGLLGGFEQGHKRPGNITGEVPPAGGRAPDGAKAIFEKAGHDACALAQQVFHIPAQVPGDLFHTAVGIYGGSLLSKKWWGGSRRPG